MGIAENETKVITLKYGVDLHVHTNASDGSNPPEEVIRLAAEAGLQAVAITDHDNTNALSRCMAAGEQYHIEVIPSIELSADGPIRPPYAVYFQGGLTWYHAKHGILLSLQKLIDAGIVQL